MRSVQGEIAGLARRPTSTKGIPMTGRAALVLGAIFVTACSTESPPGGEASAAEPAVQAASAPPRQIDWKTVEGAMGRTGAMQPGDVYRFSMPRSDLAVTVAGVRVKPAL